MNDQISWQVHLEVRSEQLDDFRSLTNEMVESARSETGILIYERFIGEKQTDIHVYERYINSSAAIGHLQLFKESYGERFSLLVDRKRFTVFGNPSDDLRALLDPFGAIYISLMAGFSHY